MFSYENRVRAVLQNALESPLVTVTAGPGYGKTRAVGDYVRSRGLNAVWVKLGSLEGAPARFWNRFVSATAELLPELSVKLEDIGFPYSTHEICKFIDILREEMAANALGATAPLIFVFDDFGHSASGPAGRLMEAMLESWIPNSRFVLVSGAKTGLEVAGLKSAGFFQVTGADLRYTEAETAEYFALAGRAMPGAKSRRIWEYTEGWPLALRAFLDAEPPLAATASGGGCRVLSYPGGKRLEETGAALRFEVIQSVFERDYFKRYGGDVREALVKLSLLPGFLLENLKGAQIANMHQAVDAVRANLFIEYNREDRLYTMHNMYREYLSGWQCVLSEDEKRAFLKEAGEVFLSRSLLTEAIECFELCGDFDRMLSALRAYAGEKVGAFRGDAGYVARKLQAFPEAFCEKHPIVDYMQAVNCFNNGELERCQNLLKAFIDRLKGMELLESRELLGKAYYLMANISMFCCKSDFLHCYAKAAKYLGGGAGAQEEALPVRHVGNCGLMGMDGQGAGALERMKEAMDAVMPYYRQVTGGGDGMNLLFRAEAAYHTLALEEASERAAAAFAEAEGKGQRDVAFNAMLLLARTALMKGDSAELLRQEDRLSEYVERAGDPALEAMMDSGEAWLYLSMGMPETAAAKLRSLPAEPDGRPAAMGGRGNLIRAFCLLETGGHEELLAYLDGMEGYYGRWLDKLNAHILRAIALMRTGGAGAMESLCLACGMAMENGVAAPFVERGQAMHLLAEAAKSQGDFDRGWLEGLSAEALAYSKRMELVAKAFRSRHGIDGQQAPRLTSRESDILARLSQGMTREEIARASYISVNTVKSAIKNIYAKLGAVNRADAVRISTRLGILKC